MTKDNNPLTTLELRHIQESYGCKEPTWKNCCNGDLSKRIPINEGNPTCATRGVTSRAGSQASLDIAIDALNRYKTDSDRALEAGMISANIHQIINQYADEALDEIEEEEGGVQAALTIAGNAFRRYKTDSDQALSAGMISSEIHTLINQYADEALSKTGS